MKFRVNWLSGAAVVVVGGTGPALAQSADTIAGQAPLRMAAAEAPPLEEIVVTGIRASLQSAQTLKQNADTVVDSIVAEDIGKLPDVTATEALQRITGIQIGRDLGEGGGTVSIGGAAVNSGIEIRGLPQVETTLNGREVFTATGSRVLNFEDIPSTLLAGIDVYKDPTADLLEGGIGGTVDLRTRKPFDFAGLELEASAAARYADLTGQTKPEITALASDRWQTGIGEIGALLSFGYQDRNYRQYASAQNGPIPATTTVGGATEQVFLPGGTFNQLINGERQRTGLDGVVQWQAADDLLFSAEASSQELSSKQQQYVFSSSPTAANLVPGSVTLFPGTTDASQATFNNVSIALYDSYRQVTDVNRQFALNGKWSPGQWTVQGDLSYTKATEVLLNPTIVPITKAPSLSQSVSVAGIPQTAVSGVDLTNINNFTSGYFYDSENHYKGNEKAARLDVSYQPETFISSVSAGFRFADRRLDFTAIRYFQVLASGAAFQANPQLFGLLPFGRYFSPTESAVIQPPTLAANISQLQNNFDGVRQELGITATPTLAPGSAFDADEKNSSFYARADFNFNVGIPVDGNIGVRVVRVQEFLTGFTPINAGGVVTGFAPLNFSSSTTDPLPSLNLRFKLADELQARFSASKVVTHPDFSQLAPSYTLLPASQLATGGNPNLKPTKADQLDGTLEWYFASASSMYGSLFYKKVKDFIFQNTIPNVLINGISYNVTGPLNGPSGTIKGLEVGYQQFFDFLPGWFSGLGMQANYTYVDAVAPTAVAGVTTTLPGLSKNSYNLIGIYEKGPVSLRVAYNWRSQFYQSVYSGGTAALSNNPVFVKQYGWLDSSATYDLTNQWSVYAQGSNLLRTRLHTFYGVETRPDGYSIDDRQYLVGFRFKF
jgi:iron complex outermembrane recepter protein